MAFNMTDIDPTITPEEIRETREGLELTQKDLGFILGVDDTTISHWELGNLPIGMPGAVKYTLEYLKLREDMMIGNEVSAERRDFIQDTLKRMRE